MFGKFSDAPRARTGKVRQNLNSFPYCLAIIAGLTLISAGNSVQAQVTIQKELCKSGPEVCGIRSVTPGLPVFYKITLFNTTNSPLEFELKEELPPGLLLGAATCGGNVLRGPISSAEFDYFGPIALAGSFSITCEIHGSFTMVPNIQNNANNCVTAVDRDLIADDILSAEVCVNATVDPNLPLPVKVVAPVEVKKSIAVASALIPSSTEFQIEVNCTPEGPNMTITVGPNGSESIDVPVGSTCTIEEVTLPTAPEGCQWATTTYPSQSVSISDADDQLTLEARNKLVCEGGRRGRLCVHKFHDTDGDGEYVDESPLQWLGGWDFIIRDAAQDEVASGTTQDGEGMYCANGLEVGTYWATEIFPTPPPTWTNTTPMTQPIDVTGVGIQRLYFGNWQRRTEPGGTLKICKEVKDEADIGAEFTFNIEYPVGSGNIIQVTVPAGPVPGGYCKIAGSTYTEGSTVRIVEIGPSGYGVVDISSSGELSNVNLSSGSVDVIIDTGVTEVTYINENTNGYIEICKTGNVSGDFEFSVSPVDPQNPGPFVVPAGACSPAIAVPAGNVTIMEAPTEGIGVDACFTLPNPQNQISCDKGNGVSVINVEAGGISTQTIAIMSNEKR